MELIELKEGPTLPSEAIVLALDLETRGFVMQVDGETLRLTGANGQTPSPLTDLERAQIRQWKLHLMAIVAYGERHTATKPLKRRNKAQTP